MHKILLSQSHKNFDEIYDLLQEKYENIFLLSAHQTLIDQDFDLLILDQDSLNQYAEELKSVKTAQKLFFPLLLIADHIDNINDDLWSIIDETIITPINHKELLKRVENLLRSRKCCADHNQVKTELSQLKDFKAKYCSLAGHELRNPLTAILFSIQILQQLETTHPDDTKLKYLHIIQERVEYMKDLLDSLLLISQAGNGKLECKPSMIDVIGFCENLVEQMELSDIGNHKLIFTPPPGEREFLLDQKLLYHILSNLLSNAMKYSPEKSTIKLIFFPKPQEQKVIFQVIDQGIGIPDSEQEQIFDSFHRCKNVGKIVGTGLGLYIVKQLIDIHQGNIEVYSKVGKGTTFTITLPLRLQSENNHV
ncbi:MAG TPA: HAMP domain-containing sensor histidine kinase [Allocoleopsis sp.]